MVAGNARARSPKFETSRASSSPTPAPRRRPGRRPRLLHTSPRRRTWPPTRSTRFGVVGEGRRVAAPGPARQHLALSGRRDGATHSSAQPLHPHGRRSRRPLRQSSHHLRQHDRSHRHWHWHWNYARRHCRLQLQPRQLR